MKSKNKLAMTILFIAILSSAYPLIAQVQHSNTADKLSRLLANKDSLLFNAVFNSCNAKEIENILGSDFVFYQDKGRMGQTTVQSRKEFLENIKSFCGKNNKGSKTRREMVKASVQVFLVNQQEAIQTGVQHFYVQPENGREQLVEESKFSRTWQNKNGDWKLAKELDYMVNTQPHENLSAELPGERYQPEPYSPVSAELYNTIVAMDSLYFNTYNTCDLPKMRSLMSDSIEFYHDKGGLTTNINEFMEAIKNNICGKVTRKSVPGSIEVYPIANYGAVEIGYHRFFNNQEPGNGYSKPDKYIVVWHKKGENWIITRVVSLH